MMSQRRTFRIAGGSLNIAKTVAVLTYRILAKHVTNYAVMFLANTYRRELNVYGIIKLQAVLEIVQRFCLFVGSCRHHFVECERTPGKAKGLKRSLTWFCL